MDKDIITEEVNAEYLKGFIYYVRGVRVMLDMDLAKIYGYSTKDFNRQVKNNIEKFEKDFMFQLTDEECEILRCKNSTSSWGGRRYNPYAFTEQGIYMLMTRTDWMNECRKECFRGREFAAVIEVDASGRFWQNGQKAEYLRI